MARGTSRISSPRSKLRCAESPSGPRPAGDGGSLSPGGRRVQGRSYLSVEIGIDSFAAAFTDDSRAVSASDRLRDLIAQIERADQAGLDSFGIGEHHGESSSTLRR